MEAKYKQRLIGVIVLLALAVIFVPLIIDSSAPSGDVFTLNNKMPNAPAEPDDMLQQLAQADSMDLAFLDAQVNAKQMEAQVVEATPASKTPPISTTPANRADTRLKAEVVEQAPAPAAPAPKVVAKAPEIKPQVKAETKPAVQPQPQAKATVHAAKPAEVAKAPQAKAAAPTAGFVVQLASFGSQDNANRLVERLKEKGYSAFTQPTKRGDQQLYRVLVGPELSREKAQAMQAELKERIALAGLVVSFNPLTI